MRKVSTSMVLLACFGGLLALTTAANASGFALLEQSGKGLGEAFAGGVTDTDDASSMFYNPAAMAFIPTARGALSTSVIDVSAKFKDEGSTVAPVFGGAPLTGGDGGDGGTTGFVPCLYYVQPIVEKVNFGLAVNAPFGLATDYADGWKGRYHALKSDLAIININPNVAVQVLPDFLSLGVGLNVFYADAELSNAIDFGAVNYASGMPLGPAVAPQTADGHAKLTGDDWAVGYSLGLLCNLSEDTRVGLSYRSRVEHKLTGKVDFDVPTAALPLTAGGMFTDSDAGADLTTPETLTLGIYQKLGDSFAVMGDVAWTNWQRFKDLVVEYDNPVQPDTVVPENWTDTMRYALGINYYPDDCWTVRLGTAWDESPVKTAYRTPRIPDNDRIWLSAGLSYNFNEDIRVDAGYTHLFIKDSKSNLTTDPLSGDLIGKYESYVNIYALEASVVF